MRSSKYSPTHLKPRGSLFALRKPGVHFGRKLAGSTICYLQREADLATRTHNVEPLRKTLRLCHPIRAAYIAKQPATAQRATSATDVPASRDIQKTNYHKRCPKIEKIAKQESASWMNICNTMEKINGHQHQLRTKENLTLLFLITSLDSPHHLFR